MNMIYLLLIFFYSFVDAKNYKTEKEFKEALNEKLQKVGQKNIILFSKDLFEKENILNIRRRDLQKREDQLKLMSVEIDKKLTKFWNDRKKLLGCMKDHDKQVTRRVSHIVEIMNSMKPQKSAEILAVQDPQISIKILDKLNPLKISKIFNLMDREVSARLQKQYLTMKK